MCSDAYFGCLIHCDNKQDFVGCVLSLVVHFYLNMECFSLTSPLTLLQDWAVMCSISPKDPIQIKNSDLSKMGSDKFFIGTKFETCGHLQDTD